MTPEQFIYWMQGFAELTETDTISEKQWTVIKDHLALVFDKQTPDRVVLRPEDLTEELIKELQKPFRDMSGNPYLSTNPGEFPRNIRNDSTLTC